MYDHDRISRGTACTLTCCDPLLLSYQLTCVGADDLLGEHRISLAPILTAAPEPVRMTVELVARPSTPTTPTRGSVTLEASFSRAVPGQAVRYRPTAKPPLTHTH